MGNHFYSVTTPKGYLLIEAISAFQKMVRRGETDEALYWAVEIYNSGYAEYLWKRIKIISSEDIGMANPNISTNISALYRNYIEQSKKNDSKHAPERLFLIHAVMMIAESEKSRAVDHALIYHFENHDKIEKEIPDVALDKHTSAGRRKGRGFKHFFEEGTRLHPIGEFKDEEFYRERCVKLKLKDGDVVQRDNLFEYQDSNA